MFQRCRKLNRLRRYVNRLLTYLLTLNLTFQHTEQQRICVLTTAISLCSRLICLNAGDL